MKREAKFFSKKGRKKSICHLLQFLDGLGIGACQTATTADLTYNYSTIRFPVTITETRLFKYIEIFTTEKLKLFR